MNVLLIEDDPTTQEFVRNGLGRQGFTVDLAATCAEGSTQALGGEYDVIVLDVMLPDGDGFSLLRTLREADVKTPTLFLTARGDVRDRLHGFELGADDYLPKPFAFAELVARLRAVALRRPDQYPTEELRVADLVMDLQRRTVERAGCSIRLSPKEFALLECLARSPGVVMTRAMLVEKVWGQAFESRSNVIDVHIKMLRDKIDADFSPRLIQTVRGLGYVLEPRRTDADGQ